MLLLLPVAWKGIAEDTSGKATGIQGIGFYLTVWMYFMMPMYSILVAILSFTSEHTQCMWKHTNAQPVSGTVQILAKHFFGWCYLITATVTITVLTTLVLLLANLFFNVTVGFADFNFWRITGLYCLLLIAGGIAMVSLLNVLAARVAGFSLPAMVGFFGTLLPIFASADKKAATFIPWTASKVLTDPVFKEVFFGSKAPVEYWWIAVPAVQVAMLLWIHSYIQKKKPLY